MAKIVNLGLIPILAYKIQELEKKNEALSKKFEHTTILARRAN